MKSFEICLINRKAQRVDTLLSTLFSDMTRTYIAKCIEQWDIRVNNNSVKKNALVQYGDVVFFREIISSYDILPENIPLDIIYEDDNLIVLNKNPGINVHPVAWFEGKSGTLVNALLHHTQWNLPVISGEERPWIVHRLDKDTSGALLIAKNDTMMQYLSGIIKHRKIKKYYLAVVYWVPQEKSFTITSHIGRDRYDRTKMTLSNPINPKEAITHVEYLWSTAQGYSLMKIELETGRTHQIRVHLANMGLPILWDRVYGNSDVNKKVKKEFWVVRQLLHAHILEFQLYWKPISFTATLKNDMQMFFDI